MTPSILRLSLAVVILMSGGAAIPSFGDDPAASSSPVATDLVVLAREIAEANTSLKSLSIRLENNERLHRQNVISSEQVAVLKDQIAINEQRLELYRVILEAEIEATKTRSEILKSQHEAARGNYSLEIKLAPIRMGVLQRLLKAATPSKASDHADDSAGGSPASDSSEGDSDQDEKADQSDK